MIIVAIAAIAAFNIQKSANIQKLSDLAFSNVEALAQDETSDDYQCVYGGLGCTLFLDYKIIFTSNVHYPDYF